MMMLLTKDWKNGRRSQAAVATLGGLLWLVGVPGWAQQPGYDHSPYDGETLRVTTYNLAWASSSETKREPYPNFAWDFSNDQRPDFYETVDMPRWKKVLDEIEYVSPHILTLQEGDSAAYRQLKNNATRKYASKFASGYWKRDYRLATFWDADAFTCIDSGEFDMPVRRPLLYVKLKETREANPRTIWVFNTHSRTGISSRTGKHFPLQTVVELKQGLLKLVEEGKLNPSEHFIILAGDFNLFSHLADDLLASNIFNTDDESTGKPWAVYETPYSQEEHDRHISAGTWVESFLPAHNSFCYPIGSRVREGNLKNHRDLSSYLPAEERSTVDHLWVFSPKTSIEGTGTISGKAALRGDLPFQPMCTWSSGPEERWDNAEYACRGAWEEWNRSWPFYKTKYERWENEGTAEDPSWKLTETKTWDKTLASDHHPRSAELQLNFP